MKSRSGVQFFNTIFKHPDIYILLEMCRAFSHDVTAAILVFHKNDAAAVIVY